MKKIVLILLSSIMLVGCNTKINEVAKKETEVIEISFPEDDASKLRDYLGMIEVKMDKTETDKDFPNIFMPILANDTEHHLEDFTVLTSGSLESKHIILETVLYDNEFDNDLIDIKKNFMNNRTAEMILTTKDAKVSSYNVVSVFELPIDKKYDYCSLEKMNRGVIIDIADEIQFDSESINNPTKSQDYVSILIYDMHQSLYHVILFKKN